MRTYEEALAIAETAKANVGKECEFEAYKDGATVKGTIKSVVIDKRVNLVLYRIRTAEKVLFHKVPTAITLTKSAK